MAANRTCCFPARKADALIWDITERGPSVLKDIAEDSEHPVMARIAAAAIVLDRGMGKPVRPVRVRSGSSPDGLPGHGARRRASARSCRPLMQSRASIASMWHTSNHATAIRAARSFSSGDASAGVISACFASIARRHWRDGVRSRGEFGEGDFLADPAMAIEGR